MVLEELLTAACAFVLAACGLWLALGVVVVLVDGLVTGGALTATRRLPWPRLLRSLVLASIGAAIVAAPAAAEGGGLPDSPRASLVDGLALPDRVLSAPARSDRPAPRPRQVRVQRGDSLWSIAARLAPGSDDTELDRAWRLIARSNPTRLGPDPDLIFPGVVLVVPDLGATLGKELS